jgi:hypothetical protein
MEEQYKSVHRDAQFKQRSINKFEDMFDHRSNLGNQLKQLEF